MSAWRCPNGCENARPTPPCSNCDVPLVPAPEVLNCPMQGNDANASTVREYLVALLRQVWIAGEGFSGKRPFGNSSWEFEIYEALGRARLINCTFDSDGYIEELDTKAADTLVLAAIVQLGENL